MPYLSRRSQLRLSTCDIDLRFICEILIKTFDFTVLAGRRGPARQNKAFYAGRSRVRWPDSAHNAVAPKKSRAVDIAPYPIDWNDIEKFRFQGGLMIGIALAYDIPLRWGGDWDGDFNFRDQIFNDLPHFEIRGRN